MSYISDRTGTEVDDTLDAADVHHARVDNPHNVTIDQLTGGGELQAKNFRVDHAVLDEQSGAIEIDFAAEGLRTLTLTTDAVFVTLNRAAGRAVTILFICEVTSGASLTFPAWKFMNDGGTPTSLPFPKEALLSLVCFGVNDVDVRAVWIEEP